MIILIGKPCSGKTTVANCLYYMGYNKVLTYTTRRPRKGEENGRDYWFVSRPTFEEMIRGNEFIEYVEQSDELYGTKLPDSYFRKDSVIILDPWGAESILSFYYENKSLFESEPKIFMLDICDIESVDRQVRTRKIDRPSALIRAAEWEENLDRVSIPIDYVIDSEELLPDEAASKIDQLYQITMEK